MPLSNNRGICCFYLLHGLGEIDSYALNHMQWRCRHNARNLGGAKKKKKKKAVYFYKLSAFPIPQQVIF